MASEIEQADSFNQEVLDFMLRIKELPCGDSPPRSTPPGSRLIPKFQPGCPN